MSPSGFAQEWQAAWNSHDLDQVLGHYAPDVVFRSAKAADTVGAGIITGRSALRDYWALALERQPDLRFEVIETFKGHQMLVLIFHLLEINHRLPAGPLQRNWL